jgi:hypothetical protein
MRMEVHRNVDGCGQLTMNIVVCNGLIWINVYKYIDYYRYCG